MTLISTVHAPHFEKQNFRTFLAHFWILSGHLSVEMGWVFTEARLSFRLPNFSQETFQPSQVIFIVCICPSLFSNPEYPHWGSLTKTTAFSCLLPSLAGSNEYEGESEGHASERWSSHFSGHQESCGGLVNTDSWTSLPSPPEFLSHHSGVGPKNMYS